MNNRVNTVLSYIYQNQVILGADSISSTDIEKEFGFSYRQVEEMMGYWEEVDAVRRFPSRGGFSTFKLTDRGRSLAQTVSGRLKRKRVVIWVLGGIAVLVIVIVTAVFMQRG